jgi:DNA repair protein RadC
MWCALDAYRAALYLAAAAVVFLHNHSSGDPMPSQEDAKITRRLKECGEMLAIRVLDHVILGTDRYYSFSDKGPFVMDSFCFRGVAGNFL